MSVPFLSFMEIKKELAENSKQGQQLAICYPCFYYCSTENRKPLQKNIKI